MKLTVSDEAAAWYKNELDLGEGDALRFFVRYGGNSVIHSGFSLGVMPGIPDEAAAAAEKSGITFYIEESDSWYFRDHDLTILMEEKTAEPEFSYIERN
ncbi:HesB/YadR/YfhF family protein [Metabacillus sp. GX 13764]|uniref:HesB/YadR/YfhF family protein n=1 Tax=Metabacillus kandeliae TaxID=2900151 RepID=UPI001E3D0CEE|nr:HesB/YadR/YfhF family protein [Metabacillus kandeliae]MCD7033646.1 HesB/YadR/YfhF family protein [Metabacillus kandeliae]